VATAFSEESLVLTDLLTFNFKTQMADIEES
jgi:hypothetical protein